MVLRLEATKGALNMFAANSNFDSSSCPVANVSWFAAASDDVGFWVLLVGAVLMGACTVLSVLVCRQFRAKGKEEASSLQLPSPAVSGAEPVIGRPCAAVGEEPVQKATLVPEPPRSHCMSSDLAGCCIPVGEDCGRPDQSQPAAK